MFVIISFEWSLSCEADSRSSSQEIPRLFVISKVHYRVHKMLPSDHTLSHINFVHTLPPYFLKIVYSLILYS
jgi:hypothetical protein